MCHGFDRGWETSHTEEDEEEDIEAESDPSFAVEKSTETELLTDGGDDE